MKWTLTLILANYLTFVTTTTGVNFVPQNEFYSTYSMWALSFSIDLTPYYANIAHVNNTIMTLKDSITSDIDKIIDRYKNSRDNSTISKDDFQHMMETFKLELLNQVSICEFQTMSTIIKLTTALDDITDLFTQTNDRRTRRSLLPWAGDLLGALIGTASRTALNKLKNQINSLASDQNELVHVVKNSLTIVNKTNSVASENRHAIEILSDATKKLDRKMRILNNAMLDREQLQNAKISINNKVVAMTNAIVRTLRKISNRITKLSSNMNSALRGELSTTLVEPEQLREVLRGISRQIPSSLSLKAYDGNLIAWYYKHLPITVIPDQNRIHLISMIPLIPVESLFTLYRVIVLPIPIDNTDKASEITIEGTHFAVSKQGNDYIILDNDELATCQDMDTTYCPLNRATMNLARMPSCLGSLYLEEQDGIISNCPIKISNNVKFPIFRHLVQGKLMIASDSKLIVHQRCDILGDTTTPIVVRPPIQIITLQSGCTGYTEYAKLPPFFYQSSSDLDPLTPYEKLNVGAELIPIWNINNSSYRYDYKLMNDLPTLSDIDKIDVTELQNRLESISKEKIIVSDSNQWKVIVITASVVICICIILMAGIGFYIHRQKSRTNEYNCAQVKYELKSNEKNDIKIDFDHDSDSIDVSSGRGASPEDNNDGSAAQPEPELIAILRGHRPELSNQDDN